MTTKPMQRDTKVYQVNVGTIEPDNDGVLQDVPNWTNFTVTALDAELAVKKVRSLFRIRKRDYMESVVKITTLDE